MVRALGMIAAIKPHCVVFSHSVVSNSLQPHGLYVAYQAPPFIAILQARILEWVAMTSFRVSSQSRHGTQVSHIAGGLSNV